MRVPQAAIQDTHYLSMESPVGKLFIFEKNDKITALLWDIEERDIEGCSQPKVTPVLKQAKKQLQEYFKKKRKQFDLPIEFRGGTKFQRKAWNKLTQIPYGRTWTYGQQASKLGDKKACRAVGGANGKNPISIIVPCHRVIGSNGSLTGFGGGLNRKKYLLELESRT